MTVRVEQALAVTPVGFFIERGWGDESRFWLNVSVRVHQAAF
jgi:hypothetical protein